MIRHPLLHWTFDLDVPTITNYKERTIEVEKSAEY